MLEIGWSADTCLNINFPDRPAADTGEPTLCRQGVGMIRGMDVETRTDPRGLIYHWINFRRGPREQGLESDIDTLRAGRIAVTPIRSDRTDERAFEALAEHLPRLGA
jgi:5'-nucleotidase